MALVAGLAVAATGTSAQAADEPCTDVSPLPCAQVKANLPLSLGFAADAGGLQDKNGVGTGLTAVQKSTGGGFKPELLGVDTAAGELVISTTAGIQYKTPSTTTNGNTLDNGLAVGLDASRKLRLETTVVRPVKGTGQAQQAGLWLGPDEDHYVKLVVASARNSATPHRIQLVREVGGAAGTSDEINFDGSPLNSLDLSTKTVRLILVVDPAGRATASYRIDGGTEQALGELTFPASFVDGSRIPAAARDAGISGLGGIFATHRNGPASVDFRFGDFAVAEVDPPAGTPNMEVTAERIVTNQPIGDGAGPAQAVTIRNTGSGPLTLQNATLSGPGASQFAVTKQPAATVAADGQTTAEVTFDPNSAGPKLAALVLRGNDPDTPEATVKLNGLGTAGLGGANEPSLQWILDSYETGIEVGDDNDATAIIHTTQQRSALIGEEIRAQAFEKAGSGSVTLEPLAVFGPTDANPVVTVGRHPVGDANARTELLSISNSPARNGQTLQVPGGTREFDPGSTPFALYSQWPYFANRVVSSEDARNTWSDGNRHHVRTFPLKGAANAYVVATEEHTSGWDFQDVVYILRNVRPAGGAIAVENGDKVPFGNRLAFNRIQTPASGGNGVHDQATARIRNTGDAALTISALTPSAGWELANTPSLPAAIAPGAALDVPVRFTATSAGSQGGLHNGTLTIASSDSANPTATVELGGFWQSVSEGGQEPSFAEILKVFGYTSRVPANMNNSGKLVRSGDEVNSPYWKRADTSQPVHVRQLAAFHTQGNTATFHITRKATGTTAPASFSKLVHLGFDGQSLLPRKNDASRTPGEASVTPTTAETGTTSGTDTDDGTFGFRIDPEYSDWKVNRTGGAENIDGPCLAEKATDPTVQCGYHLRAFAARDRAGKLMPNTWLITMDYAGINYDFQDNVYLVSNVKPEDPAVDPNVPKPCSPVACDKIAVGIPYELDFGAPRAGTVADKDDLGTGFTHVDPPANGTGYIKGNLDLDGGELKVTTTNGLQFSNTTNNPDSQDNQLGVGLDWRERAATTPVAMTTRALAPPAGTRNFEQGGLWFGRDGDNYVKLVVGSFNTGSGPATQIQFLKEQEKASATADECKSPALDLTGKNVDLKLIADPASHRVTAAYTVTGAGDVTMACSFTVPASWFDEDPSVIDERIGTGSFAGVFASHRNGPAPVVYRFDSFGVATETVALRPTVLRSRPADGETGVARDVAIATDLSLPNGSVDNTTVTDASVRLVRVSDGAVVAGTRGTSGGGDTLTFTPSAPLAASTAYRFEVTDEVRDLSGARFAAYSATFTTGTGTTDPGSGDSTAAFDKVVLPTATAPQYKGFTSLAFGPDGKLYGGRNDGEIRRWTVGTDGQLGQPEVIGSLQSANGGDRLMIGMEFDPSSTPSNPVLWVSHTTSGFSGMPDWGGKITRLSGADLQTVQDYVVNLPRSARDHVTNGIDIKDGKLYFTQGSNSAMGAADSSWGNRPERVLSAAVLRLDPAKVTNPPLNAQTDEGGTYDPYATDAPLTIFATGVRNAYDLAWHSNGKLYVPTNGSAAGGNTPTVSTGTLPASCARRGYTGPGVVGTTNVPQTQHDWLFRVEAGGYYGHPNPSRCEWVLNGGNPTSGNDGAAEVPSYAVGTQPDPNYRGTAFDFGLNKSPNGVIEYRSTQTFGGTLAGKLLVLRYSNNDDVIALTPGSNGDIARSQTGITGASGFKDPLDLVENPTTGDLYVSEYDQLGNGPKITLLRARTTGTPTGCEPASTLPCAQVKATPPVSLDWDSTEGGLANTGFKMALPSSKGGVLRPELLSVGGGRLNIRTTAGIQYKDVNTLDNALGVGLDTQRKLELTTTLVNPPLGTGNSEQGGLWLGPNEDDYVKVVVASVKTGTTVHQRAQLLRERDGVSAGNTDPALTDEINTTGTPNWSAQPVRLRLVVDPVARTAEGFYRVGAGEEQRIGQLSVPADFFDGTEIADARLSATGVKAFGGVFATHRNSTTTSGLDFAFDDFSITEESAPNRAPVVAPLPDRKDRAGDLIDLAVTASDADGDALTFSAEGLPAGLSIAPATGRITGTIADSAARQQAYQVTVRATDGDGESGTASFAWTVDPALPAPELESLKVNFSSPTAAIPAGYVRDYGQSYAPRGGELSYGWVVPGTGTPLDLSVGGTAGNGRDRALTGVDPRLNTFMHMQYDDVANPTNGNPAEGAWELALADGRYDVTVAVGDPNVGTDPEIHTVRAEGTPVISGFVPSGIAGSATRHKLASLEDVEVADGRLTLDAVGGTNTKIAYVEIERADEPAPTVTAVQPADGATGVAVDAAISATFSAPVENASITVRHGATEVEGTVHHEAGTTGVRFVPAEPLAHETTYTATVNADGATGRTWSFTTAEQPNRAPVLDALENQSTREGAAVTLDVKASDPDDDDLTFEATGLPAGLAIDADSGEITGIVPVGAARTEPYKVTIKVSDGELSDTAELDWTVLDGVAPRIESIDPADGATGVPVTASVTVRFSEALDAKSVNPAAFVLRQGSNEVARTVSYDGAARSVQVKPAAPLAHATAYTVEVTGVRDADGNVITSGVTWSFTTAQAQVDPPPATNTPPVTDPPPAPAQPTPVRVNAGGPALTLGGVTWSGCRSKPLCSSWVDTGSARTVRGSRRIANATATSPATLYRTYWTGTAGRRGTRAFAFELPVRNGDYRVRLHFAEVERLGQGARRFDVVLEKGWAGLNDLDVMAEAGGRNRALVRELPVRIEDGAASIAFVREQGRPMVSAIEVLPAPSAVRPAKSRLTLGRGGARTLNGALSAAGRALGGRVVVLEARSGKARRFSPLGAARTRADGTFRVKAGVLRRGTAVRAAFAGDAAGRAVRRTISVGR